MKSQGLLTARLLDSAARHAARPAIWSEQRTLSYHELFAAARHLGSVIDAAVPARMPVAILTGDKSASIIALLSAILSHRAYVPVNPSFPLGRMVMVAEAARPGAIICTDDTRAEAAALLDHLPAGCVLAAVDGTILARSGAEGRAQTVPPEGDDTAYLMFTSGTTGTPKGVRVLQSNVAAYLDGILPLTGITAEDRLTQFPDHHFDLSVHDLFAGLVTGAELSILPRSRMMEITDWTREREITAWCSVPSLLGFCDRLGQLGPDTLPGLRVSVFCGEALPVSLARRFMAAAPNMRLINLYGPTEATVAVTAYEVKDIEALSGMASVPLGWPMGAQIVRIGEADDAEEGEMLLGGSQVAMGYVNNPAQSEEKFFADPSGTRFYRTGDLVRRSAAFGSLFVSRMDDQVKVNGYRVELLEVDAAIAELSGSPEVASIAWPLTETGQAEQIVTFVTSLRRPASEIRRQCRDRLPPYMIPRRIIEIDTMPVSINGKIDRKRLREMLAGAKD